MRISTLCLLRDHCTTLFQSFFALFRPQPRSFREECRLYCRQLTFETLGPRVVLSGNPVFLSSDTPTVDENEMASFFTVVAEDWQAIPISMFNIIGGNDSGALWIDSWSGELTFTTTPDFENPMDFDGDNFYEIEVEADDMMGNLASQFITIEVIDVADSPSFTSIDTPTVDENEMASSFTVAANDSLGNPISMLTISGGDDFGLFYLDSATGDLEFYEPFYGPDYENPLDANGDNFYEIEVEADDMMGNLATQLITIEVTDVADDPTFSSTATPLYAENSTNAVLTVLANDYQAMPISSFSITGGSDAGELWIDSWSGELWFYTSPDYEAPLDANVDNFYEVEVQADDMIGNVATQLITVEVTDANDDPIEISFFSDTESSDEYRFTDQNGLIGLTVMLSSVPATDVTVDFDVFDDMAGMYPAVVADDLVDSTAHPLSDTLTFSAAASEVSKHITFEIFNDGIDEYDETFIVQLSNPSSNAQFVGGLSLLDTTGTILDDDSAPSVTIDNNLTTNEGDISAVFTITLSHESEKGVNVDWQAVTGTVVEDPITMPTNPAEVEDFDGTGMESFGSSETTRTIYVNIADDDKDEYDEFFEVQLTSATNASIVDSLGIGAIFDNDSTPFFTIDNNLAIGEADGTGTFTITLSRASEKGAEVTWSVNTGLNVEDPLSMPADPAESDDFDTMAGNNEIFGDNETSRAIDVAITDDLKDEFDEFFEVHLASPLNASILDSLAIGGILNDDDPPDLVIGTGPTFSEPVAIGDSSIETITVDLSVESEKPIDIEYVVRAYDTNPHNAANPEWAELNDDFTPTSGTLNFIPGDTSKTFNVTLKGDNRYEYDEVFKIEYSEPFPFDEPVNIPNDTLVVTIEDEDAEPTISVADEVVKEGASASFVLNLSHPTEQSNQLDYSAAGNTALTLFDYATHVGSHTFGPNDTTHTVTVSVHNDGNDEPTESFDLAFNGGWGFGVHSRFYRRRDDSWSRPCHRH